VLDHLIISFWSSWLLDLQWFKGQDLHAPDPAVWKSPWSVDQHSKELWFIHKLFNTQDT